MVIHILFPVDHKKHNVDAAHISIRKNSKPLHMFAYTVLEISRDEKRIRKLKMWEQFGSSQKQLNWHFLVQSH